MNKRSRRTLMSEINVTPFVDVLLVLLVVFVIAAPLITNDLSINLPQSDINNSSKNKLSISLWINKDGVIYYQEDVINFNKLEQLLSKQEKTTSIYIKADQLLVYQALIDTMSFLHKQGFNNISLVTVSHESS